MVSAVNNEEWTERELRRGIRYTEPFGENRHKTNTRTGLSKHMALENLKIGIGVVAILLGIPILISPIGIIGPMTYILSQVGIGLILVLGGIWAVWMNW
jgi:hypothetical protein